MYNDHVPQPTLMVLSSEFHAAGESYLLSHVILGKRWCIIVVEMLVTHVVVPLIKVDGII